MADYRKLYFTLLGDVESAIRTLISAQQKCEELYLAMEDDEEEGEPRAAAPLRPPIRLFPERMSPEPPEEQEEDSPL